LIGGKARSGWEVAAAYKGQAEATVEATVAQVVNKTRLVIAVFSVVSMVFIVLSSFSGWGRFGPFICNFDVANMTAFCNGAMSCTP